MIYFKIKILFNFSHATFIHDSIAICDKLFYTKVSCKKTIATERTNSDDTQKSQMKKLQLVETFSVFFGIL